MGQGLSQLRSPQLQLRVDMLNDQLNRDFVFAASWHDDVSVHHCRCNVIGIRRLHHGGILFQNAFEIAAALRNVSEKVKDES